MCEHAIGRVLEFMSSPWVPLALKWEMLQTLCALAAIRSDTMQADPDAAKTACFIVDMVDSINVALVRAQIASETARHHVSFAVVNRDEWRVIGFPFADLEKRSQ